MEDGCLISVVVISYNSEKFIHDTLDSILQQTYPTIELIISDDASKDKTLEIAEHWLSKNKNRFVNTQILRSEKNRGISSNLNRGIRHASGKYIKEIAADDMLTPFCLENAYHICEENGYDILFSNMVIFYDSCKSGRQEKLKWNQDFFEKSVNEKKRQLCHNNILSAPTAFYKKQLIETVGYFDEYYKYMEDYPMWIKILENGYDLAGKDFVSVFYRKHDEGLSNLARINNIINTRLYYDDKHFFYNKRCAILLENKDYKAVFYLKLSYLLEKLVLLLGNRKNIPVKIIMRFRFFLLGHLS